MADIFNEIDEELRRDKAQIWWKQYGKFVIGACAVFIACAAGYTWYQEQRTAEILSLADRYGQAQVEIQAGDTTDAVSTLNGIATDAGDLGVALVARFRAAGLIAESGDSGAAAAAYSEIASDTSVDVLYRDLAAVMAILHESNAGADLQSLLTRIEPLAADGQTWRFTARMIAASLAIGLNEMDKAQEYLKQVADDPEAPNSARGQAAEILQAIGS